METESGIKNNDKNPVKSVSRTAKLKGDGRIFSKIAAIFSRNRFIKISIYTTYEFG